MQACQSSAFDPTLTFGLADAGTEEMWIDTDGTPYLYYTGPDGRYIIQYSSYSLTKSLLDVSQLLFYFVREVKVFLICDKSVKVPIATTTGDSKRILEYVSQ